MVKHSDDLEDAHTDASNGIDLASYQRYLDSLDDGEELLGYNDPDWRDTREADIPRRQ